MADRSVTVKLKIDNSDFIRGLAQSAKAAKAFQHSLDDTTGGFDDDMRSSRSELSKLGDQINDTSRQAIFLGKGVGDSSHAIHQFGTEATSASKATDKLGASSRKATNDQKGFFSALNTSNDRMSFLVQTSLALGPALIPAFAAAVPAVGALALGLGAAAGAAGVGVLAFQGVGDGLKALNDFQLEPTAANLEKVQAALEQLSPAGIEFVSFLQDLRPEIQGLQDLAQVGLFPGLQEGISAMMTQLPAIEGLVTSVATALGDLAADAGGSLASPFWTDFINFLSSTGRDIMVDFAEATGHVVEGLAALGQAFGPLSLDFSSGMNDMAASFADWAKGLDETQGFQDFVAYVRTAGPQFLDVLAAAGDALVSLAQAGAGVGLASLQAIEGILRGISAVLSSPIGPPLLAIAAGLSAVSRAVALYNVASGSALLGSLGALGARGGAIAGLKSIPWLAIAGGVGLLATSLSDLDDEAGLSNTATFASAGAFFGGWGVAVGGAVGAAKDMAEANNDVMDSIEAVNTALQNSPSNWDAQTAAMENARTELDDFKGSISDVGLTDYFTTLFDPGSVIAKLPSIKNKIEGIFGTSDVEEAQAAFDAAADSMQRTRDAAASVANAFAGGEVFSGVEADLPEITDQFERLAPAIDAAGTSQDELIRLASNGNPFDNLQLQAYLIAIGQYANVADSTAGKTQAIRDALSGLDDPMLAAADAADALSLALHNLLDPNLDLQEATDAYTQALKDLDDNLAKHDRTLKGNSQAALTNRGVLRSLTRDMLAQLDAFAKLDPSAAAFGREIDNQVHRFMAFGRAAGFTRQQLEGFLKQVGLTPKEIRVLFRADTKGAQSDVENLKSLMEDTSDLDPEVEVTAITGPALSAIQAVQNALNFLDGQTASTTVTTVYQQVGRSPSQFGQQEPHIASGGQIHGPGTGTSDSIPAWLSDGEFVVNAASAKMHLDLLHRINARKFAAGGLAFAKGGNVGPGELTRRAFHADDPTTLQQLARAFREMAAEARDVAEAEKDLHAARENSKEANHAVKDSEKALEKARREAGDKVNDDEKEQIKKLEERLRKREKAQRVADKQQAQAEKELTKQRDQLAEATDRWKQKQQELIDQAKAIQDAVQSAGAIFGGEGTSVTVGGLLAKLRDAAKKGREFNRNIAEIRASGLDPNLVDQLLEAAGTPEGWAAAENLANASRRQLRNLNAAQSHLEHVARRSGEFGFTRGGGGGVHVEAKFTGPITTTDVHGLDKKLEKRVMRAVKLARQK